MKRLFSSGRSRPFIIATVAAMILAGGATYALGASHHATVQPDSTVFYQATTSGQVIGGENDGTGIGIEGLVGNTAGAIGMLGFATSLTNSNVAMEGLAWGPSSTGLYGQGLRNADTTHPTVGLLGTSTSGYGVEGQSLVATTAGVDGVANDGSTIGQLGLGQEWGVHGVLNSTGAFEAAVDGSPGTTGTFAGGTFALGAFFGSNAPAYGAIGGGSSDGILGGAFGTGASSGAASTGVYGADEANASFPDYNDGMYAASEYGIGLLADAGGTTQSFRPTTFSTALWVDGGNTNTSSSYAVGLELEAADASTDLLYAYDDAHTRNVTILPEGTNVINGYGPTGSFSFDGAGNLTITGLITTGGACSGGCAPPRSRGGRRMLRYGATTTEPTIEDFGEGQMMNGVANVRLEGSFASAIDGTRSYLVFLTPEGDNRGLYVTQRTPSGFTVREAQGGRSTLAFMYRIVAKPYGVNAERLPMVDMPSGSSQDRMPHGIAPRNLGPYERLVAQVGKSRADQLVKQYLARLQQGQLMQQRSPHADTNGTLHLGSTVVRPPSPNK